MDKLILQLQNKWKILRELSYALWHKIKLSDTSIPKKIKKFNTKILAKMPPLGNKNHGAKPSLSYI